MTTSPSNLVLDFPLLIYQSENVVAFVYANEGTGAYNPGRQYTFTIQKLKPNKIEHSKSYRSLLDVILECCEKVGQMEHGHDN